jgi:NAD(P)-dependent dehydrogenase (short-subunit alcohol dehydrogenase family)
MTTAVRQGNPGVALVTGAGRGFGRSIAEGLAREGYSVALVARSREEIDAVAGGICSGGGRAVSLPADVTDRDAVRQVVAAAEQQLGPVTLLVNNAGTPGPFGPLWTVDTDAWWASQALHIRAPVLLLAAILPGMVERRAGRIIIVSALASRMAAAYLSAYCVGKIAQTRLVEEVALEAGPHGVAAFSIDPGFVFTRLAAETVQSPDAQRWLPGMVARVRARQDDPGAEAALAACAARCVALASGRYDALAGRYLEMSDDLDQLLGKVCPPTQP